MKNIKLSEQLSISAVAQGYWRLDGWGFSTDQLIEHMYACVERGVTTLDTAEIYADTLCEKLMGMISRFSTPSNNLGTKMPAMPLEASMTTFSGRLRSRNFSTWAR